MAKAVFDPESTDLTLTLESHEQIFLAELLGRVATEGYGLKSLQNDLAEAVGMSSPPNRDLVREVAQEIGEAISKAMNEENELPLAARKMWA